MHLLNAKQCASWETLQHAKVISEYYSHSAKNTNSVTSLKLIYHSFLIMLIYLGRFIIII